MTDLNKMWTALEKYQPFADQDGHGESWRVMCSERTIDAAAAAWAEAGANAEWAVAAYAASAAYAAAWAAETAEGAAWAYWSDRAIKRIENAIKERQP
jgi:hypothetical protein